MSRHEDKKIVGNLGRDASSTGHRGSVLVLQKFGDLCWRARIMLDTLAPLRNIVLAGVDIWMCFYVMAQCLDKSPVLGFSLMALTQVPLLLLCRREQIRRTIADLRKHETGWETQRELDAILKDLKKTKSL